MGHFIECLIGANSVVAEKYPFRKLRHVRTLTCVRPMLAPAVLRVLAELRAKRVRLVADFDDLLFAGPVSGLPPAIWRRDGTARLHAHAMALEVFDRFTVSTRTLARAIAQRRPDAAVTVIPNGLSAMWVKRGRLASRPWQAGDPRVIRYFSGSPSHDLDFAQVAAPLKAFLSAHVDVKLELVGDLNVDLTGFPVGRVRLIRRVPYEHLPRLLASSWVNLAPLGNNAYNDCKSAIKFLEAGAFGCPTLASPIDDMRRHHEAGAPILLCSNERDWFEALSVVLHASRRIAIGGSAADYVSRHGMASIGARLWLENAGGEGRS